MEGSEDFVPAGSTPTSSAITALACLFWQRLLLVWAATTARKRRSLPFGGDGSLFWQRRQLVWQLLRYSGGAHPVRSGDFAPSLLQLFSSTGRAAQWLLATLL